MKILPTTLRSAALLLTVPLGLYASDFQVGAAQVKITPPAGTPLAGSYALRVSNGTLDDLYAKAIVVEQDGAKAAFVGLDLSGTTRPAVGAARKLIAERCGISPDRVMISATHTHSGPVQKRGNRMDDITGATQPLAVDFTSKLPEFITQTVAEANTKFR